MRRLLPRDALERGVVLPRLLLAAREILAGADGQEHGAFPHRCHHANVGLPLQSGVRLVVLLEFVKDALGQSSVSGKDKMLK